LNHNPFASDRIGALRFRFPEGDDWERLLTRLQPTSWRGAVIGPHGSGKTTLLTEIEPRLIERGFYPRRVTFSAQGNTAERQESISSIASLRAPDFLLLDGAEQLTTRQWLSIQSGAVACAGCLITQHRQGRLPTIMECGVTPELLNELVHELCGAWLPEGEAPRLLARHQGNIRKCLNELYTRWDG
jgi:hypothetical protein